MSLPVKAHWWLDVENGAWGCWLRVCGYGPFIGWNRRPVLLFSERYHCPTVLFGRLKLKWFKP